MFLSAMGLIIINALGLIDKITAKFLISIRLYMSMLGTSLDLEKHIVALIKDTSFQVQRTI